MFWDDYKQHIKENTHEEDFKLGLLLGLCRNGCNSQEPIIRVKQIGTWSTPGMWWKGSVTQDLDDFLTQDKTTKPVF